VASLNWVGNRDELAVRLADPKSGDPSDRVEVFAPSGQVASTSTVPASWPGRRSVIDNRGQNIARYAIHRPPKWAQTQTAPANSGALVSEFHQAAGPVEASVESNGFFDVAPTPSGNGGCIGSRTTSEYRSKRMALVFWLPTSPNGNSHDPKLGTLVYPDRIAISPTKEMAAVTSGLGRETWANKAIAISI
jgi:hypothetical protein